MTRIDRMFASLAKLLLTVHIRAAFFGDGARRSTIRRFPLPAGTDCSGSNHRTSLRVHHCEKAITTSDFCAPEIASLANHKIRRSRSTGSQL
jgi:hypothetical protein